MSLSIEIQKKPKEKIEVRQVCKPVEVFNLKEVQEIRDVILGIACLFILRSMLCILMNLNLGIKADFDIPFISYGKLNLVIDVMSLSIIFSIYRRKDIMLVSNSEPIA